MHRFHHCRFSCGGRRIEVRTVVSDEKVLKTYSFGVEDAQ